MNQCKLYLEDCQYAEADGYCVVHEDESKCGRRQAAKLYGRIMEIEAELALIREQRAYDKRKMEELGKNINARKKVNEDLHKQIKHYSGKFNAELGYFSCPIYDQIPEEYRQ